MARPTEVLKALLVGRPKDTAGLEHERLTKRIALAVFASDNLSSAAYATEEMLGVLVLAGVAALSYSIPIAIALVTVVGVIALSYQGTIRAYPSGGGAYIVAHDNLGTYPGLVAAAALMIDYVLTVAVSVAAGIAAIVSFAPRLDESRVPLSIAVIALITILNLRGIRESGRIFAVPTYAFIFILGGMILWGLVQYFVFGSRPPPGTSAPEAMQPLTILIILNAFARGSSAVTGIEAISNGVPTFREPAARNAGITLLVMASLLAFLFLGISILARLFHVWEHTETKTVIALIAERVFGGGPMFVLVLGVTAIILFLAANTSYAGFPALGAVLARDRFVPRQLMNRGDRLAYSNGILGLAVFAALLVWVFDAEVTRLLNLYVMGVFTALTLSQFGMVPYWQRHKNTEPRWRRQLTMNVIGGSVTLLVLIIVLLTRFTHGGYIVVAAIPVLVLAMKKIRNHYDEVGRQLRMAERRPTGTPDNHVILLVGKPSQEEVRAFFYAERIRTEDFHTVHFRERGDPPGIEAKWARQIGLLPTSPALEIVPKEESLARSLRTYIERQRGRIPSEDFVTVIVSEHIKLGPLPRWGTRTGFLLKTALLFTPGVIVTNVPYLEGASQTAVEHGAETRHIVLLLVSAAHNATLHALQYANTLSADEVHAIHVALDPEASERHIREWHELEPGHPLELIESPHRRLAGPLRDYVRSFTAGGRTIVTLLLPEFVVKRWWQHLLHNQNALFDIKLGFLTEPDVIVTSVPYRLE
jgi:amino acid transporter